MKFLKKTIVEPVHTSNTCKMIVLTYLQVFYNNSSQLKMMNYLNMGVLARVLMKPKRIKILRYKETNRNLMVKSKIMVTLYNRIPFY